MIHRSATLFVGTLVCVILGMVGGGEGGEGYMGGVNNCPK